MTISHMPPVKSAAQKAVDKKLDASCAVLEEHGLSAKVINALEEEGILTVSQLLNHGQLELKEKVTNFGDKSMEEVLFALKGYGFG